MNLFDPAIEHEKIITEAMAHPGFDYLNRSAHEEAQQVRELLESWFEDYPADEQLDLARRFRSSRRDQHHGALFELFLHALCRRLDCELEVHPTPSAETSKRPDFLVRHEQHEPFYLESRVAMNETALEAGRRTELDRLYDRLADFSSPDFFLNIVGMHKGAGQPPSAKVLKHFLRKQLEATTWEDVSALVAASGLTSLPRWIFRERDWVIEFAAIPKSPTKRGQATESTLGLKFEGIAAVDPRSSLVRAVKAKASRYGPLDHPFVVAVNCIEDADEYLDVFTALYGNEHWVADLSSDKATQHGFKPDGVWMGERGPQNLRVSAVLVTYPLFAWNIASAPICLYHHPFSETPYTGVLTALPQVRLTERTAKRQPGKSLAEIFGLHAEWPRSMQS